MQVHYGKSEFQAAVAADRARGPATLGPVPTMGALHDGHVSLVRRARADCTLSAVSIFVNPLQFAAGEDFGVYPRTLDNDLALLERAGVDHVFVPTPDIMYAPGFQTSVLNTRLSKILCGASRPGHFDGVLTVVMKLINIAGCEKVYFGLKDYQQFTLVRRMAADLDMACEVVGCPTVREESGLARSSRNIYLSDAERESAANISAVLRAMRDAVANGETRVERLRDLARPLTADPAVAMDYLEFRSRDLETAFEDTITTPAMVLVAARVGQTRLIDNMPLGEG